MDLTKYIFTVVIAGCLSYSLPAQNQNGDSAALKQLVQNSQEEIEALSLYPDNIREAILESTLHPELLVKIGAIQNKTSQSFKELIQYLPETDQKKYWELTKYNGLIKKLVEGGQKTRSQVQGILKDYPNEVHEAALDFGVARLRTLEKIHALTLEADEAVEVMLKPYQKKTQDAIHLLIKYPEVIYMLTENLKLAILVGDLYAKNPDLVRQKLDAIQADVSRRYAEEINEWQEGLKDNPRALQEFEQASAAFSQDNGYIEYDPMYPNAVAPKKGTKKEKGADDERVDVYYHYYYHYPYWFGYPAWYPSFYWYWYPYWYHWGYYYGDQRAIMVVGLPSYYFVRWYFGIPYHHYLYPHFSDYVIRYYNKRGPGPSRSGLSAAVGEWENESRSEVTRQLISDDSRRLEKLKEYGQFERNYRKVNESNRTVTRDTYLEQNSKRYPNLTGETRNTIYYRETPPEKTIRQSTPPSETYKLNRARDLHQRTWERSEYNHRSKTPSSQPASRTGASTKPKTRTGTGTSRERGN
ncbi:hypothetical protein C900_04563 [Fulvivirga imtechensis AK7]|uniref:DUF3300 domain-containing protein n=1 Tax=Fulvivirga imtechensis AK7 TaxID=1237149 RepID=L8JM27_9BACT|nr:hypothetical protein [Fulvivirga imtechensis]ELR69860.1 hypothetical protein C900_04563 [Fulvivirga imtechensis AK7]